MRTTNATTASAIRLPDFVIIGAAKAGTTTLYEYLSRHPQVFMPAIKEPEFFATSYRRGLEWYGSLFAAARVDQRCGEASTLYSWWEKTATAVVRMAEHVPKARLIYILRHPVERTYSDYGEQVRTARTLGLERPELRSFSEFIASDAQHVNASAYIDVIEVYLAHFARDALLVLLTEDLKRDPQRVLKQICTHIGVDSAFEWSGGDGIHARSATETARWALRQRLTRSLRGIPGAERLAGAVPKRWRELAYSVVESTPRARRLRSELGIPPMTADDRALLLDRYREPTKRLEVFLGQALADWIR